ncbi:hypothetical protein bmyco0003_48290 [Bacillus pseudomycoides]|nr:hypothetical protein bmyco0002_58340 [Bacillus pseudomycoides]EEM08438.1 hypothetical protein bmyco0003_48290 [Bacillus pseudomycoides]
MTFFMNLLIQSKLQLFAEELHKYFTPSFLEKLVRTTYYS